MVLALVTAEPDGTLNTRQKKKQKKPDDLLLITYLVSLTPSQLHNFRPQTSKLGLSTSHLVALSLWSSILLADCRASFIMGFIIKHTTSTGLLHSRFRTDHVRAVLGKPAPATLFTLTTTATAATHIK